MKPVQFLGDSLQCLRDFPVDARQDAGYQLDKVQRGLQPDDFKPMPTIGRGVEEIRIRDDSGIYRVIYTPGLPMPYSCCTRLRRKRSARRNATSRLRKLGSRK